MDAVAGAPLPPSASLVQGLRPLQPWLDRDDAVEICVNEPGTVWIESHRTGWERHTAPALDLAALQRIVTALGPWTRQDVGETHPLLGGTLPGGQRIQLVIPPACPPGTVSMTIRRPFPGLRTLPDFVADGLFRDVRAERIALHDHERELVALRKAGDFAGFFRLAVRTRQTIVVAGRTGCGKTTFMKGLMEEIPRDERLITIEDAREVVLPNHPNKVHLLYSKGNQGQADLTPQTLLQATLRMRPDRIFLAEVRGDECLDFIESAVSGHPGSITSLHAGTVELAFARMALMILRSPAAGALRLEQIHAMLTHAIDIVVQFGADARGRKVQEIWYDPASRLAAPHHAGDAGAR